jgi:hypothetical protein
MRDRSRLLVGAAIATVIASGLLAAFFARLQSPGPNDYYTRVTLDDPCSGGLWSVLGWLSLLAALVAGPTLLIIGVKRQRRLRDGSGVALVVAGISALAMCVSATGFVVSLALQTACD